MIRPEYTGSEAYKIHVPYLVKHTNLSLQYKSKFKISLSRLQTDLFADRLNSVMTVATREHPFSLKRTHPILAPLQRASPCTAKFPGAAWRPVGELTNEWTHLRHLLALDVRPLRHALDRAVRHGVHGVEEPIEQDLRVRGVNLEVVHGLVLPMIRHLGRVGASRNGAHLVIGPGYDGA